MKNIQACFSSNSVHWSTPSKLYQCFMDQGYIDPCPLNSDFNGLEVYNKKGRYFINPPFKDLSIWCDFILKLINYGSDVWLLCPCRTDTRYFMKIYPYIICIYFFDSRLRYSESKSAPFPSMLLHIKKVDTIFDICNYHTFKSVSIDSFIKNDSWILKSN